MDLFSLDFKRRKQVADCIEFMKLNGTEVQQSIENNQVQKGKKHSPPLSLCSTDTEDTEVDIIPSTQQFTVFPKLKRCVDLRDTEVDIMPATEQFPVVAKRQRQYPNETLKQLPKLKSAPHRTELEADMPSTAKVKAESSTTVQGNSSGNGRLSGFKFPITNKVKTCVQGGKPLKDEDRRQLIRECVTCLQAKVGEVITNPDFKEASKIICDQIPILKDPEPPHWPNDMEFPYWSSVLYLLKKRYLNLRSRKPASVKATANNAKAAAIEVTDKDLEDMNKELVKELAPLKKSKEKRKGRKEVNWDNVKKLQSITFEARSECFKDMQGRDIVENVLEKYPYLDVEQCLWNELELHIGNGVTLQEFRNRWSKMALCFIDESDMLSNDDSNCIAALEVIHEKFNVKEPLLAFIPEDATLAGYLESLTANEPLLVGHQYDDDSSPECQVFLVIDKDIILECQSKSGPDPLITLLGAFFAFNLSYPKSQGNIFRFLEEHVLGKVPKRKTYLYRKLENSLLLNLKDK